MPPALDIGSRTYTTALARDGAEAASTVKSAFAARGITF
ncbi:MAG: hypothetical protein JWQ92_2558 [Amnibacterium sp.]|nr:hypothetical protein [Amnibacterium sp.]